MKKLLVITGPTATGKTDLALFFAKKFNGELISVDSRQVYKNLDIGSGKMPGENVPFEKGQSYWILDGIKIWMYDVASPENRYTVSDFVVDASGYLEKIEQAGKLPILVGGTGLYLKAFLYGLSKLGIPINEELRKEIEEQSLDEIQKKLQDEYPELWEGLNNSERGNKRRLVRHIEQQNMYPHREESKTFAGIADERDMFALGLNAGREIINQRIDERVLKRINEGMIEEVDNLVRSGLSLERLKELGLEYGIISEYLKDEIKTRDELINKLQTRIHAFAKRQMTWFRKQPDINWFDITEKDFLTKLEMRVLDWYNR